MNFNKHLALEGQHAFLGASKYHWINYSDDKLFESYTKSLAVQRGTELHDLACRLIRLKQRLPRSQKTLNMYVNDAIGFNMIPEQVLYYSMNCFGTADAISFKDNVLRIHDLKTGETQTHMEQLYIYAALFCLEYNYKPGEIKFVLRIYQNDDIMEEFPDAEIILPIMDKIKRFDKIIDRIRSEEA